jgi:uncharacterized protein with GYD domain
MATFAMLGKYSREGIQGMSQARTEKARELVKKCGGTMQTAYALLGEHDLLILAEFPSVDGAAKASIALSKLTGIAFATSQAIPVDEFDKLMASLP